MIKLSDITFSYPDQSFVLRIPSFVANKAESIGITGESGSGKSTLLQILAGIFLPDTGKVEVDTLDLTSYGYSDRQDFRMVKMGLIFQEFELLEYLSVADNVLLPFYTSNLLQLSPEITERAKVLLDTVGLWEKRNRRPARLSQGERQRVAICRALVTHPEYVLCDEPTANLDRKNRDIVIQTLLDYITTHKSSAIFVTHDLDALTNFDKTMTMDQLKSSAVTQHA